MPRKANGSSCRPATIASISPLGRCGMPIPAAIRSALAPSPRPRGEGAQWPPRWNSARQVRVPPSRVPSPRETGRGTGWGLPPGAPRRSGLQQPGHRATRALQNAQDAVERDRYPCRSVGKLVLHLVDRLLQREEIDQRPALQFARRIGAEPRIARDRRRGSRRRRAAASSRRAPPGAAKPPAGSR